MPPQTPAPNLDRLRDQRMVRILGDVRSRLGRLRRYGATAVRRDGSPLPCLIVGYEATAQGDDALALGLVLAETRGMAVLAANVVAPAADVPGAREHRRRMDEAGRRLLSALPFPPPGTDVEIEAVCIEAGSAVDGLRRLAAEVDADTIVLGSTHRGRLGRILPGSVGGRLLGRSPCAVAVAPRGFAGRAELSGGDPRPRVIGVGYDGSPQAQETLRVAADLARLAGAALRVVAVGNPHVRGPAAATAETQAWAMHASYRLQDLLREVVAGLPDDLRALPIYVRGDPAANLIEAAEQGIDLLVIGARSRGPLRSLPGSVCGRVMSEAPCPVIVVPDALPLLPTSRNGYSVRHLAGSALAQDPPGGLLRRRGHRGRGPGAGLEPLGLDAVDDETGRQTPESPGDLDRVAEAERVGGGDGEGAWERTRGGVEARDRADLATGADRIGDNHQAGPFPGVDQASGLTLELDHLGPGAGQLTHTPGNEQPGSVVAAERVADPDHPQPRSTSRRRKWVAQEMHGS